MGTRTVVVFGFVLQLAFAAACGGGNGAPTSPDPAPSLPAASACGVIGAGIAPVLPIVNGAACSAGNSPVVLLNLENEHGLNLGACSGTLIAPRAILTGAHCLDEGVRQVKVWLGAGPQLIARSFAYYPNFRFDDSATRDVGIVHLDRELGPAPVPLLTSRDGRIGETAVIAGWGRDENNAPATLRAGTALITAAGALYLETQVRPNGSSICSGDSGGPILLSQGGQWSVAGVISASSTTGCINTGTGFYVSMRNPEALAFVLQQVPGALQR